MAFFVKLYDDTDNARYNGLIADNIAAKFSALGQISDSGLFSQTDLSGVMTLNKKYRIDRQTIYFKTGVQADNGDFLLHGSLYVSKSRNKTIIIRINKIGSVLWCKSYNQANTRFNERLVKSTRDTYFFSSWVDKGSGIDDLEIVKINGDGVVLTAVNLPTYSIRHEHEMIAEGDGVVVYGGTGLLRTYQNFVVHLDTNLLFVWGKHVGYPEVMQIRDLVKKDDNVYVAVGESDSKRSSFIFSFNKDASSYSANIYDFLVGDEDGSRQVIRTDSAYYVVHHAASLKRSTVQKYNPELELLWVKELDIEGSNGLFDILREGGEEDELLVAGYNEMEDESEQPLLAYTDKDFNSCSTEILVNPRKSTATFVGADWSPKLVSPKITVTSYDVIVSDVEEVENKICPRSGLDLEGNLLFQSPYVYLQAAGSDESDDSVRGFHLRWDLLRSLGETHLPKGDYSVLGGDYPTSIGFNREDDYVRIYKNEFEVKYYVDVDFSVVPSSRTEVGVDRVWRYNGFIPIAAEPANTTDVEVVFTNRAKYDILKASVDPAVNPLDFVKQYDSVIEVRTIDKHCFAIDLTLSADASELRFEAVSISDTLDESTRHIACRKTIDYDTNEIIYCDNVEYIRFDFDEHSAPSKIRLITYDDYILGTNLTGGWAYMDQFALDDGQADSNVGVYRRLEDSASYTVDGKWRKYNEPDVGAIGEFRVSVANYKSRWEMLEGLQEAVVNYLTESQTDVEAVVTYSNDDPVVNDSEMDLSYLRMLNFVALDYHVARMLGLGHIDHDPISDESKKFIYIMEYITDAALEGEAIPETKKHFYMTPPTSIVDYKLPPEPVQKEITYGVYGDNKTGTPTLLTTPEGYNPYGPVRYINIHRESFEFEKPFENFFQRLEEFCLCSESHTVLFGLEYANDDIATANPFVRPEISHDSSWIDAGGLSEVAPIPNAESDLVYVHEEENEGIHHYALYSINWFSRVSAISNKRETDYTEFPKQNTLLPPSNLGVQLIQPENPRIFTTEQEQLDLDAISDSDKTYVRITFDWNQIHNSAYQTATGVELFWRESEPLIVKGKIRTGAGAITVNTLNRTVDVETESYYNASVDETVTPEIAAADASRFIGARLTVDGAAFVVESVIVTGVNPTFRLKQVRVTASQDVDNSNVFCTTEEWLNPEEGKRFLIAENLDSVTAWDEQLAATVSIEQFSTHTETVTYEDGTSKVFTVGGLTGSGTIADIPDPTPSIVADHVPLGGPSEVPTGAYTITFDTELLPAHPNTDPNAVVDYYSGSVRVHDIDGNVKVLNVWRIEESGGVTELTAYDPTFGLVRDASDDFVLTGSDFTPVDGYVPITLGAVAFINFHPSYRVYVKKGTGASTFIDDNILPDEGMGTKNTYIAVRSIDDTIPLDPCESFMTPPTVLLAREIVEPVPPGIPTGPLFATRPNFYGKATYTFDVEVVNPFALIFYRANGQKILDQLYKPVTVQEILDELEALESPDKDFFQDRWSDLVNVVYDPATFLFKEYTPGGFKFRIPDNDQYKIPHANSAVNEFPFAAAFDFSDTFSYSDPDIGTVTVSMEEIVKQAINGAFLPLTEIPSVYKQLQDEVFQTSGRKPVIRNPENGKRYLPDEPEYDPWPMALRFEKNGSGDALQNGDTGYGDVGNTKHVRFTDYTLDGAAKNFYFYFGVELAATLAVSDRSPVFGPIQLVNSEPTVAPEIKKTTVQRANRARKIPAAVHFELNEYLESDGIKKFNIYRTTSPEKALSVRTMDLAKTVDFGEDVLDDFSDQLFPLYGDPLFYRVVALREIVNEQGNTELVPSIPSNLVLTNVVDNQHPLPPKLIPDHTAPAGSPIQISAASLSFRPTAYNATYFLYYEGGEGNWKKILELNPDEHNNADEIMIDLVDTDLGSGVLDKQDADLNPIFHRFRVDLENSAGLPNIQKSELTI